MPKCALLDAQGGGAGSVQGASYPPTVLLQGMVTGGRWLVTCMLYQKTAVPLVGVVANPSRGKAVAPPTRSVR